MAKIVIKRQQNSGLLAIFYYVQIRDVNLIKTLPKLANIDFSRFIEEEHFSIMRDFTDICLKEIYFDGRIIRYLRDSLGNAIEERHILSDGSIEWRGWNNKWLTLKKIDRNGKYV